MIKRKYVIIFLSIYIFFTLSLFAYASLLAPLISRLAPTAMAATGVAGGFTIPAKIVATTSTGAKVASWISLAVPGVTAAKVAVVVLGVAGAMASDYLMLKGAAWFAANNISKNDSSITGLTGDYKKNYPVAVPNGYTIADYNGSIGYGDFGYEVIGIGIYANSQAASAAITAKCIEILGSDCGHIGGTGYKGCGFQRTNYIRTAVGQTYKYYYAFYPIVATHMEDNYKSIPPADIESTLAGDLANENAAAKDVAKAALEVTANAAENPSHPLQTSTTTNNYSTINNYLTSNITTNQTTNLEAAATTVVGDAVIPDSEAEKASSLTAAQIAAAVQAALAGQNLSAAQIAAAVAAVTGASGGLSSAETTAAVTASLQNVGLTPTQIAAAIAAANPALTQAAVKTAVKEALDDVTDVPAVVDPTIIIPDKLSLTTVMQSFVNTIKGLPIFAVLNGITINVSGSSQLCLNLPSQLGGSKCWDGSNMQSGLNMIGSAFLGLTSIISFIGIFKG